MATFVLNTTDPYLIYPATGKQAVIANRDDLNSIALANDGGLFNSQPSGAEGGTLTDPNITVLDPGGYMVIDGADPWYALAIGDLATVSVTPGASALVVGPAAIAAAIVDSGLSVAVADALANGGVSLLATPKLLYSLPTGGTPTPGTLVGATIGGNLTFAPYGADQATNDNLFDSILNRPMALTVQKIYIDVGQTAPSAANLAVIAQGAAILASIKPAQTASGTYSDSTVTTQGTTCLTEKNRLTANMNALLGAGLTTGTLKITLWQEPNSGSGFDTAAHYQNYLNYYLPAVRALSLVHVYNPLVGSGGNWNGFTGVPANSSWDELMVDYYGSAFNTNWGIDGTKPNDPGSYVTLAANHTPSPAPFGVAEFNDIAGSGLGSPSYWNAYQNYMQGVLQTVVSSGGHPPIGWLIFWMGNHANTKPNNQISTSSDFKVPLLQQMVDAFGGAQRPVLTIANGATVSLTPLAPVPNPSSVTAAADGVAYELTIGAIAGAASVSPFLTFQMQWYATSDINAPPIAQQYWTIPMGTNGTTGTVITGRGPQYGAFLRVNVHNLDAVPCTMTFEMNSNGRPVARDDWLWDVGSSVSVPGFTLAGSTSISGNQLGILSNVSVPASGSITRLLGMFSGPTSVRLADTTGKLTYIITPVPSARFGTVALMNITPNGDQIFSPIYMPRGPLQIQVNNSDTVAHGAFAEITMLD